MSLALCCLIERHRGQSGQLVEIAGTLNGLRIDITEMLGIRRDLTQSAGFLLRGYHPGTIIALVVNYSML